MSAKLWSWRRRRKAMASRQLLRRSCSAERDCCSALLASSPILEIPAVRSENRWVRSQGLGGAVKLGFLFLGEEICSDEVTEIERGKKESYLSRNSLRPSNWSKERVRRSLETNFWT